MPPRKKKKRPDTRLKDYLEERDVLMEFLKIKELRGFCKKLHKTWEALDNEKGLELELQKLLAYWKIIDQQTRQIVDERKQLEIFKIDKTLNERLSVITEKKNILSMCFRDCQTFHNFKKSRIINQNITRQKLFNREKELMHQAHKARKKCIIRVYDGFRAFMHSNTVAYKKFLPIFYKFSDQFTTLQGEYYDKRYQECKKEREKQTRNELQMLKRKERLTINSMYPLIGAKEALRILNKRTQRGHELNIVLKRNYLRRVRGRYVVMRRREKELKNKLSQELDLGSSEEINSMLNISRHTKDIIDTKKKLEEQIKSRKEQIYATLCQYAVAENDYCNETKFVKEVRKLSLDEADNVIINHMAKKLLSSIKMNSIKKKIRIVYYILKNILKSDVEVDSKTNEVVTSKRASSIISLYPSKIINEEDSTNLFTPDDNDPFCLNCVPDIHVPGFIPDISMHHTCKDFIAEHKHVQFVDFNNEQPDEQFKLFKQNASGNRCIRLRMEKCLTRNNSHLDNAPVNIKQQCVPKLNKYIKNWEDAMKKILQKNSRYQRYYEVDEEDEQEVEGEEKGKVGEEESVQEEIEGEQDKWEEKEQMEIDKQVSEEKEEEDEEEDEDSSASSTIESFMSSETVTSAFL